MKIVTADVRRNAADVVLCVAVFLTTFFYRFNTLGGALGGFSNDEFGYLARARQIQAGEVPFRDFNDPGWFLTDYLSAAAQWLGGYNLRSEALLTVGLLSVGAALTFALARRAAGSVAAALAAVAMHVALDPRHYNYPKIVLCAAGLALAWAYLDRPNRVRLGALGALTGIGFLFRHDYLVYLGALSLVTIAVVDRASMRDRVRAAVGLSAVAAMFVVPFLVFLTLSGGIGEYFRSALVYVQRDAQRTSFSLPRFSIDPSKPLIAVTRGTPAGGVYINVRWMPASNDERRGRESSYKLAAGARVEGATWRYRLEDVSRSNIESLVRDPLVEDTQGLDRTNFTLAESPPLLRLETQLDTLQNATAFLYYGFLLLPVAAAVALLRMRRAATSTRVLSSARHLVPLLALAVIVNIGLLSRGSTNIRIPDVGVTAAIVLAWLMSIVGSRDAHLVAGSGVARAVLRTAAVVVLCLTVLSVNGLAGASRTFGDAGFTRGPVAMATRTSAVWRELGVHPSAFNEDDEQPSLLRIAAYIRACTAPEDRLFVLGVYPELYYFSDRRFAGGHAWLLPFYYSADADEALIVRRLKQARAPIALTERRAEYDEEYRDVFEHVHEYLQEEYTDVGDMHVAGAPPLRLLVRADRQPVRRYEPLGLPCFTPADAVADR